MAPAAIIGWQAESRERDRRQIVEKGPEQILPNRSERHTRQPQRLDDFHGLPLTRTIFPASMAMSVPVPMADAKVRHGKRGSVIDAVADKPTRFFSF